MHMVMVVVERVERGEVSGGDDGGGGGGGGAVKRSAGRG
jgi:hypothetical protein